MKSICTEVIYTTLILGLRPVNERRRYKVTPPLIGWAQTKNHPCMYKNSQYIFIFINVFMLQGVFNVCAFSGREVLLRAPTNEDRQVWSHAIGAVIRAQEGIVQVHCALDISRCLFFKELTKDAP